MAIQLGDRPQVGVKVHVHEAETTTAVVNREELVAQEWGLTGETVKRVWKVLEADVRREIEASIWLKYSLLLAVWTLLALAATAFQPWIGTAGLLAVIAAWVGLRAYCQTTNYDVPWERKVGFVWAVSKALRNPKPGDEIALHTPLIQAVMLVAHEPAREELARRGLRLRIAINADGFCGQTVRAEMAKDLVTAFGATPIVGDLTI